MNYNKITRLEIIEDAKRKYVKWDCRITESIQDNGRTLKLFIIDKENKNV